MQFSTLCGIKLFPKDILKNGKNICCGVKKYNLPNINVYENKIKNTSASDALENFCEDLSEFTPYFPKSFNLAAYVNKSEGLQNLMHLGVNLSKIEKKPYIAEKILKLDFEQNIKKHIMFLKDYVDSQEIGNFITKNPMILCEALEDLEVRVNYLKSKRFTNDQVEAIITKNPFWLMFSTTRIDRRLGYFQENFSLSGKEVKYLSTKLPKLITYNLHHVKTNKFVITEEMGFEECEVKQVILKKPKLLMLSDFFHDFEVGTIVKVVQFDGLTHHGKDQKALLERFNYLHNVIKVPHSMLLHYPGVLLSRNFKVKQRHLFLQKLGRAQYDPKRENYVPIMALVEDTDVEFCKNYAKCNVDDFNIFLKTL